MFSFRSNGRGQCNECVEDLGCGRHFVWRLHLSVILHYIDTSVFTRFALTKILCDRGEMRKRKRNVNDRSWMNERMNIDRMNEWMNEWMMNEWMNERTNEQTNERTNERMKWVVIISLSVSCLPSNLLTLSYDNEICFLQDPSFLVCNQMIKSHKWIKHEWLYSSIVKFCFLNVAAYLCYHFFLIMSFFSKSFCNQRQCLKKLWN
jgi:hypothetical protein